MLHIFNPQSIYVKLDEFLDWIPLTIMENRALSNFLSQIDKAGYYRSLIKLDKFAEIPINPNPFEIKSQMMVLESWAKSKGIDGNTLNSMEEYSDELFNFSLQMFLNKRVSCGKFVFTNCHEMTYLSPYGIFHADAYLYILMKLYGVDEKQFVNVKQETELPEKPINANHPFLDKPIQLDGETQQKQAEEKDAQPM